MKLELVVHRIIKKMIWIKDDEEHYRKIFIHKPKYAKIIKSENDWVRKYTLVSTSWE